MTEWADIAGAAEALGLAAEGFRPGPGDGAPAGTGTLVLLGYGGAGMWRAYTAAAEASDGLPDPLDRWSARVIGDMAARFGARAIFPNDGPPYPPFMAWAQKAADVWPSRLGMMIHRDRGVWVSFRGALALPEVVEPPGPTAAARPCDPCPAPCLSACPVGAFSSAGYDVAACAAHLRRPEGADCLNRGCLARRACPVGRDFVQAPAQARHHMGAFLAARGA